jgi:Flp pilus assembly protein TadB
VNWAALAEIVAPVATTIAAIMVAANLGSRITGFGFIVFSVGSIAWMAVGVALGQQGLIWQNVALLGINLFGVWRWLGLRARYDKGAAAATESSS